MINIKRYIISLTFLFFVIISNATASEQTEHKIAVLVNDQMITTYDIIQRMKLNAVINRIDINSENNQFFINSVADELIQEKLKNEKIVENKIKVGVEEFDAFETRFLKRVNFNKDQIIDLLENNNISYEILREFLYTEIHWQKLINTLYYRLASASEIEINEIVAKNENISIDHARDLVIQRQLDLNSSKLLRDMYNEATIEYR